MSAQVITGGYRIDEEDREFLHTTAVEATYFMRGEQPESMDPRNSPLAGRGFLQVEMQGGVGACQGVSLTDCAEFAFTFATGEVTQFDWMFAYVESQKFDSIRGDDGSTLSAGTKVGKSIGFAPETNGGRYPQNYPGWQYSTTEMKTAAQSSLLMSHTVIQTSEQARDYIGSGNGIVHIGMPWGDAMENIDRQGCITEWYRAVRDGGHAWVVIGYVPDSVVGRKSSTGWWLLCKNSWSKKWGPIGGYFYFEPKAFDKVLRDRMTTCLGRSDMKTPRARKIKFDFTKNSLFGKM